MPPEQSTPLKPSDAPKSTDVPKFDIATLNAKLNEVKAYYTKFKGKDGFNPHFYLIKFVAPLAARLTKGETSVELAAAINSLVMVEPSTKGMIPDFLKMPSN